MLYKHKRFSHTSGSGARLRAFSTLHVHPHILQTHACNRTSACAGIPCLLLRHLSYSTQHSSLPPPARLTYRPSPSKAKKGAGGGMMEVLSLEAVGSPATIRKKPPPAAAPSSSPSSSSSSPQRVNPFLLSKRSSSPLLYEFCKTTSFILICLRAIVEDDGPLHTSTAKTVILWGAGSNFRSSFFKIFFFFVNACTQ